MNQIHAISEGHRSKVKDTPASYRRKTVLVAGGAGFLGSRICERYIDRGYSVYCLDNLSTGRLSNISHLVDLPQFSFFRHDVIVPISLPRPVSLIYNMACAASPPRYQLDPIHTMLTCVRGAINLLDLAHRCRARILQASTSEVYGDPTISPQCETYFGNVNTVGPRSCYDEGKRAAETLFHDYHHARGVDIRIARIFNTYGPGMDPEDGRVVSNFVTQALKGEPISIYGRGAQTRSFCYRDDLVEGLLALMHCKKDLTRPVNIGNPAEFTIAELANHVLTLTGSRSPLCYQSLPQDDPQQRRPDISVAMRELGWRPKVGLVEGLQQTISYFASELGRNTPRIATVVV